MASWRGRDHRYVIHGQQHTTRIMSSRTRKAHQNNDAEIRTILRSTKTIGLVGASSNPERPSNEVMLAMKRYGYRVIPINPMLCQGDGRGQNTTLLGEKVYASLSDYAAATKRDSSLPKIDMVDIFRRKEFAGQAVDEAIAIGAKFVWMQIGVIDEDAAQRAKDAGLLVAMDCCPYDLLLQGILEGDEDAAAFTTHIAAQNGIPGCMSSGGMF